MSRIVSVVPVLALMAVWSGGVLADAEAEPSAEGVRALIGERRFEEAAEQGRELLDLALERRGDESSEAAEARQLTARAMAMGHLGDEAERLELANKALTIKRSLLDGEDPSLAASVYVLGLVHNLAGSSAKALPYLEEAFRIAEQHYGSDHEELERYCHQYGTALFAVERLVESKTAFECAERIRRAKHGDGKPEIVSAVFNVALAHVRLGEFDDAEMLYREVIEILEGHEPLDVERLAFTLTHYGTMLARAGRLTESLEPAQRALELRRNQYGPDSKKLVRMLNNLAMMLDWIGDDEEALKHLENGLRIQGPIDADVLLGVRMRVNLASLRRARGDLERARQLLEEAKEYLEDMQPSLKARFHEEFAALLNDAGSPREAREHYRKSLALFSDNAEEDDHHARVLTALGTLEIALGEMDAARESLERSLTILERRVGIRHPRYVTTLGVLSTAHLALGHRELAFDMGIEADRVSRELARATVTGLPERQALAHAAQPEYGRDVAISIALGEDATPAMRFAAYDAIVQSRAIVFDEIATRNRSYESLQDRELTDSISKLRETKTRLANLFVIGPDAGLADYTSRLDEMRREVERIEAEIARRSAEFRSQIAGREFSVGDLQERLPDGSAGISYVRYRLPTGASSDAAYAAVVQTSMSTTPIFVDLGSADDIESAISGWRAALKVEHVIGASDGSAETRYRVQGDRVRRALWDPIAEHVEKASLIFVIPDAAIHLVSFAALPVGETAYLLERAPTIHHLTAERDLARAPLRTNKDRLLAMGNPTFGDGSVADDAGPSRTVSRGVTACMEYRSIRFEPLPAAAEEARAVEKIWKSSKTTAEGLLLEGAAATEAAVKRHAPEMQVLHFATHGFFLGEDCAATGGLRGIGALASTHEPVTTEPSRRVNPQLLSGLAFAGANGRSSANGEDGILTAEEVSTLDLQGVRLAVLSACRTGAGSVTEGEGVFGLRRAFQIAGAHAVVTNLWDVEDRSARVWIEKLYEEFLAGTTLPEAVRAASLSMLDSRRAAKQTTHPFYWGGWLAVGSID